MITRMLVCVPFLLVAACSKGTDSPATNTPQLAASPESVTYRPLCPEDGRWNQCLVLDKLVHAGVAPAVDSADTMHVKYFTPPGIPYRIGKSGKLVLFYFPDSMLARKAWDSVDTLRLVATGDPTTADSLLPWGRRPASFRAANVVGAFMSDKREQVERVLAVFAAGLPVPVGAQQSKP